jgi:hypothetical protein
MFLVGHAAVAAALTSQVRSPVLAFGIGWLSHYLVDFFPHGDEVLGEWTKRGREVPRIFFIVVIDAACLLGAHAWYLSRHPFSLTMLAAMAGSVLPDVMWGLEKLFRRKFFGPHEAFHNRNHNFFALKVPYHLALTAQLVITAVLWWRLTIAG